MLVGNQQTNKLQKNCLIPKKKKKNTLKFLLNHPTSWHTIGAERKIDAKGVGSQRPI